MKDLIERLEKATRPDRELDGAIQNMLGPDWPPHFSGSGVCNAFTASLDAALTLVPEGCSANLHMPRLSGQSESARVWNNDRTEMGVSATPALALCIAALKARHQMTEQRE